MTDVLNHKGSKKELQTKNKAILAFIFPCVVTFTGLYYFLISLYGINLLSGILLFQPKELHLTLLVGKNHKQQTSSAFDNLEMS